MSLPDGIYLNLDFDTYRADPALGSHDLLDCLTGPVQWHGRNRNEVWRQIIVGADDGTPSTSYGTALHAMALEPEAFGDRYFVAPAKPDLPETISEIKAAIDHEGHARVIAESSPKIMWERRAAECGIRLVKDWAAEVEELRGDRQVIHDEWATALNMLHAVLQRHSQAPKFLRNGRAEVSMFWTDANGDRWKVRFDYLRIRTVADVKTHAYRAGEDPITSFCGALSRFGYDFLAAVQLDARITVLPRLVEQGLIINGDGSPASDEDFDFFGQVAAWIEPSFWFVACMTGGGLTPWKCVPEVDTIEFPRSLVAYAAAQVQVEQARTNYRTMREAFGDTCDSLWVDDRGLVRLTEFNFSQRTLERGMAKWEKVT
jgi:PDDEXK-like uncharacterized protein DUF3799